MENNLKFKYFKALSHAARATGDKRKALDYIREGLKLKPNNSDLLQSLGYTYWYFSDFEMAIKETEKALVHASDKEEILKIKNNLAFYYAELAEPANKEKAIEYAKEAYDKCPRQSRTFGYYADTYGYVKFKFAKRVEEIDEAIKLFLEAERAEISLDIAMERIKQAELKRKKLLSPKE